MWKFNYYKFKVKFIWYKYQIVFFLLTQITNLNLDIADIFIKLADYTQTAKGKFHNTQLSNLTKCVQKMKNSVEGK